MSLTSVNMSEDVWLTCLTHALSTETEEIIVLKRWKCHSSDLGNIARLNQGLTLIMTISTGRTTRVMMMSGHKNEGFVEVLAAQQSP